MPTVNFEIPETMRAAVYRGEQRVVVEEVPTPRLGAGELLLRVEACGICHTDLKKIEYALLPPPRIYGHETAGVVAAVGAGVTRFAPGDRVIAFHHIPCGSCFYCVRKLHAQCPVYKKVGITAGFEPAGGGFAQYVRVMDWIVERGVERIPEGVSFDVASFVEPVNTCLKGVEQLGLTAGDLVLVQGQGPIGLIFTMMLAGRGCTVVATDTMPHRRQMAMECGAALALDPLHGDVPTETKRMSEGRGADAVISATAVPGLVEEAVRASRPGARILLFAQTSAKERIELAGSDICVGERVLMGSYSASVDLQKQSADLVFQGTLPVHKLVSHALPLAEIEEGFLLARKPLPDSLKIVVRPQQ